MGFRVESVMVLVVAAALAANSAVSLAQSGKPFLFQKPALSSSEIVFSFAGDLWTVPRAGGDAKRLTAGVGIETDPAFSPDGKTVAFTGEYDGNVDVYVGLVSDQPRTVDRSGVRRDLSRGEQGS